MEAIVLVGFVILIAVCLPLFLHNATVFKDPSGMTDQEILSAIAGQADWLERQALHVAKYGGSPPHADKADRRREYIFRLCEALVARHPEPKHLFYNATKRATQLQSEGVPHKRALVSAVKERLFADNGHVYRANWNY